MRATDNWIQWLSYLSSSVISVHDIEIVSCKKGLFSNTKYPSLSREEMKIEKVLIPELKKASFPLM